VSASALVSNWLWSLDGRQPRSGLERWLIGLARNPRNARIAAVALLSLPLIIATWLRVLEPAAAGLVPPPSTRSVVVAAAVAVVLWLWLWVSHRTYVRSVGAPTPRSRRVSWHGLEAVLLAAIGLEAYWAFVRGALLSVGLANTTLAVFLSLGVLAMQAWASPAARAGIVDLHGSAELARRAHFALLSALVFLATGSLIVCVVSHISLGVVSAATGLLEVTDPETAVDVDTVQVEPTIV
jgi:hypothetical protein